MAAPGTRQRPTTGSPQPERRLLSLEEIAGRLERALELSTADETELAWIETADGRADGGGERTERLPVHRTILIRVREGARRGAHRTGAGEPSEILNGIRQAIAASRATAPLPVSGPWTENTEDEEDGVADGSLSHAATEPSAPGPWDPEVAALDPSGAADLLRSLVDAPGRTERMSLEWTLLRVVVRTGAGLDRRAEATAVTARAHAAAPPRSGPPDRTGSHAGWAAGAARSLAALDPAGVLDRARQRAAAPGPAGPDPGGGASSALPTAEAPILFSPEAAASLVALLVRKAFSSSAFDSERSPLAGLLGEHVFAPEIDLVDDGLDPAGLPFPFDLLGRPRERIELVTAGVPRTPAVDEHLAARLGRRPTPHALGPEDARPIHPFLLPRHPPEEVMAAAEGGLWIAGFEELECFDPGRIAVRGRSIGARRVRGGELAEPVPAVIWEDSLLRLFSKVRALGGTPVVLAEDGGMGGVSAPMVCAAGAERLTRA
ncbi:MAG: metallopeptidase TldD-related protein [Acidobacteriota bacterium]|jgi:hypothetical protein